jgi:biopolymer transport protein ExbB/TolQ
MMLFEDVVSLMLIALGIYGIYRAVRKAWEWADIKATEEQLSRLQDQEKHINKVKEHHPIDRKEVKKKLDDFIQGESK